MKLRTCTVLLALSCARKPPVVAIVPAVELNPEATAGVVDPELKRLLHDHWEDAMARSPVWATQLGDRRFDDQLGDPSTQAIANRFDALRGFLARARALDTATLSHEDSLTAAVFEHAVAAELALEPCRFELWSVSPARNAVAEHANTIADHPIATEADLDALFSRVAQMPAAVQAEQERLKAGRAQGLTPGAEAVRRTLSFIDGTLGAELVDSPFFIHTRDAVADLPPDQRDALTTRHAEQVRRELLPALAAYRSFLADTLLPDARAPEQATLTGLSDLPGCYPHLIQRHTTLELSPEEIHAIGLAQMEKVHAEFRALAPRALGDTHPEATADLQALFAHLRSAPELRFDTPEAIVATAETSLRSAEDAVKTVFHTLPDTPCTVEPIPANIAPYTYVAWYEPPTADKDGIYRVNTHAPETRLRHEARALAFHESVPGHHLQLALAQELPDTPAFRRHNQLTAYIEGWALYSERLADELDLYPSDVDRLGMLSYDAWRSARLVVDTGLHHYGWTRAQAEAWMRDNTPLAENNIANEVDRYIGWPGQALGYKLGQLELLRLRAAAESTLGDRFVLADFHSVVLDSGPVPMPVLADRVERWMDAGGGPPQGAEAPGPAQ